MSQARVQPGRPGRDAFFLDADGTLLDLALTPDGVLPDARLVQTVQQLHAMADGALALISGRPVRDLDRLFAPWRLPCAGQHGAERRDALGHMHQAAAASRRLDALRQYLGPWAAGVPGILLEDKGASLAVHYRQAPELAAEVRHVVLACLGSASEGLRVQAGKCVVEVGLAGQDKGSAIRAFLAEAPFRGRTPVMLGDDATDEDGFAVVLQLGGRAIKVGPGDSLAHERLRGVAAVRDWLEATLAASARDGEAP